MLASHDFRGLGSFFTVPTVENSADSNSLERATSVSAPSLRNERSSWGLGEKKVAGEDAHVSGMAGRYANALFELALEQKAVDSVQADLDSFEETDHG